MNETANVAKINNLIAKKTSWANRGLTEGVGRRSHCSRTYRKMERLYAMRCRSTRASARSVSAEVAGDRRGGAGNQSGPTQIRVAFARMLAPMNW